MRIYFKNAAHFLYLLQWGQNTVRGVHQTGDWNVGRRLRKGTFLQVQYSQKIIYKIFYNVSQIKFMLFWF